MRIIPYYDRDCFTKTHNTISGKRQIFTRKSKLTIIKHYRDFFFLWNSSGERKVPNEGKSSAFTKYIYNSTLEGKKKSSNLLIILRKLYSSSIYYENLPKWNLLVLSSASVWPRVIVSVSCPDWIKLPVNYPHHWLSQAG